MHAVWHNHPRNLPRSIGYNLFEDMPQGGNMVAHVVLQVLLATELELRQLPEVSETGAAFPQVW